MRPTASSTPEAAEPRTARTPRAGMLEGVCLNEVYRLADARGEGQPFGNSVVDQRTAGSLEGVDLRVVERIVSPTLDERPFSNSIFGNYFVKA